jgi:NDP-sugar pyrophosphorylase family protein
MQLVILAGGLATRLFPLTSKVPKSMLEINKRPFLEYQLELLKEYEIKDVLLCLGYKGELIKNYFGDGKKFGVNLSYSYDGEKLLGTAGALKKAYKLLNDNFLLMYGDSYLPYDYWKIEEAFKNSEKLSLMVVHKNQNRFDKSNILIADDLVKVYDKTLKGENLEYIDAGLSILKKEVLSLEMLAYEVKQRFYQIGSLEGLEEFKNLVEKGAKIYDRY